MELENINLDIEATILSAMILAPKTQRLIFSKLKPKYFSNFIYREIFSLAKTIFDSGTIPDNVLIFQKAKKFKKHIGETLVDLLTNYLPMSVMVEQYIDLLFEAYIQNAIKNAKTIDEHNSIIAEQKEFKSKDKNIVHISFGVDNFEAEMAKRQNTKILTGYESFDDIIGSFMGGDYIALGGSTSSGKTALALNITNMLCIQGLNVLYASLEMPLNQLQNRFVCMLMGLNAQKYRSCGFDLLELEKYKQGMQALKEYNLNVVTDYYLTTEQLRIYAEKLKENNQLDFLVVDYLGLLNEPGNNSPYIKMSNYSRALKQLATDLNIPVLVLIQLNRDFKNRQDKKPVLTDIRESGAIEQDADFVLFTHREYMYSPHTSNIRDMELIMRKNRHGELNKICRLDFEVYTQRISEWRKTG